MFHQNMTIKLWLVIWLSFIGLYLFFPPSELFEQENFVLPLIENNAETATADVAETAPGDNNSPVNNANMIATNEPAPDAFDSATTTLDSGIAKERLQNANLPYIPDLEVGVTEREHVLNTLGKPARQLQQGKILEYYFEQDSEVLHVLSEEESNLLLQNELDAHHDLYHLLIEFDYNNVIMAMNMQPL
ncbi:hypothetical protein [Thalassotalea mangrovi]|uniref:Uncharacterized protein n=1 Tax=Thalassotalea mangrovi TaxID=2572245 RepID=A0A4U1B5Q2_9GAMM|nr:hypothetical protein [Thalassotalea mangrovi]TKB45701.1 hypothetical protein E8M12_07130 [Thalassotalea mangrovi]